MQIEVSAQDLWTIVRGLYAIAHEYQQDARKCEQYGDLMSEAMYEEWEYDSKELAKRMESYIPMKKHLVISTDPERSSK